MHLIIYCSVATFTEVKADEIVTEIADFASAHNETIGVTGVLFYESGHFLQAIEGGKSDLDTLYASIKRDSRHSQVITLIDKPIPHRSFEGWTMDTFFVADPNVLRPETLQSLRDIYHQHFDLSTERFLAFLKDMADQLDLFRIKHSAP